MNPTLVFYGLLLNNLHRYTTGEVDWDEFEAAQRLLWRKAGEAHVTLQIIGMLQQVGRV